MRNVHTFSFNPKLDVSVISSFVHGTECFQNINWFTLPLYVETWKGTKFKIENKHNNAICYFVSSHNKPAVHVPDIWLPLFIVNHVDDLILTIKCDVMKQTDIGSQ